MKPTTTERSTRVMAIHLLPPRHFTVWRCESLPSIARAGPCCGAGSADSGPQHRPRFSKRLLELPDHAVGRELHARAFGELAAVGVDVLQVAARVHLDGEAHEAAAGAARRA